MRTIKYRGWGVDAEMMHQWEQLQKIDKWWNHDAVKLMQFTGLLDKFGKEIYEGDIVRYGDEDTNIVEWANHAGMYQLCDKTMCADSPLPQRDCGIIGNVYQDSHLLDNSSAKI